MKGILSCFSDSKIGSIGIGAMIVFVAMVLVAGIAASVLIQSAGIVERKGMETGQQTTAEVATGLKVTDIEGRYTLRDMAYNTSSGVIWRMENDTWNSGVFPGNLYLDWHNYSRIHNMTMTVTPNPGSSDIDISHILVEITNSSVKCLLSYDSTQFSSTVSTSGLFSSSVFDLDPDEFGIIVIADADGSISSSTSTIINAGDRVMLTFNVSACFFGFPESTDVWGSIILEEGASASFEFRTPATYKDVIYNLF
jgi:flagellin FlaB